MKITETEVNVLLLRKQGLSETQIAEKIGVTKYTVRHWLHVYGINGPVNDLHGGDLMKLDEVKKRCDAAGVEYVGGYVHSDSFVTVRCKKCGAEFQRSFVSIRKGKQVVCHNCTKLRAEARAVQERKEIEARNAERQKKKAETSEKQIALREAKKQTKVCVICGKPFDTYKTNVVCCSPECSKRRQNHSSKKRYKNITIDSDITLDKLFYRDYGVCYLCGTFCDWNDYSVRPDGTVIAGDFYPSVDHVIAIANGGLHSWDNVKLAHRRCNYLKRDS